MTRFPEPLASVAVFVLGTIFGSFLNVCIYRMPRGESVVRPRSRCPACGRPIPWQRNVPILSWLFLRGACADCGGTISWRYPFVELLGGLTLLGFWHAEGPSPAFAIGAGFGLALIALFYTDLDHQILPDKITLSGLVAGLAVAWANPFLPEFGIPEALGEAVWTSRTWTALFGAALGSGLLWGFGTLYSKLRGVEAMGMGDVKMMAMVGAFTGPSGVLVTIFGASIVGAVVGLALIPLRGRSIQDALPFGCFLAPAAAIALVAGQRIADGYWHLLLPLR